MPQDLTQSAKKIIVDMINEANDGSFTEANTIISAPRNRLDNTKHDTAVTINKTSSPDEADGVQIYYNRLDLAVLFEEPVSIEHNGVYGDTLDLLPELNDTFGLNLTSDDIESEEFTVGDYPYPVVLKAKGTSLIYKGQFSLDLTEAP